jgi:ribosomal protein S27E
VAPLPFYLFYYCPSSLGFYTPFLFLNNGGTMQKISTRGIPSNECLACGSTLFTVQVQFDEDYNVASYLLNAECAICGSLVTAPTAIDHPEYSPEDSRWL